MPEPLKNIYNDTFFEDFTNTLQHILPDFNKDLFLHQIYDEEWENRELKQRMRHLAVTLRQHLPDDYRAAIVLLLKLVDYLKENQNLMSFGYMFLPDYIEVYGMEDLETSIHAMEEMTQLTSCEFAVRPFIIRYPEEMIDQMLRWSKHPHDWVRRFSSEGCRPRLPWAMALPALKNDPSPILPILENLKNDESEFVRKSVANNLNDISKDNPELAIRLAKRWKDSSKNTDWVVKHACRTLLKQAHPEALKLFGFGSTENIKIEAFKILTPVVKIGDYLEFVFQLKNLEATSVKIRLEYGLYYLKANGSLSKKVFMISEKDYAENSTTTINRRQSFRLITTRKFYPGRHELSLIINGNETEKLDFELIK